MTQADGGWRELMKPALAARFVFLCLGIWLNAADALVTVTIMPSVAHDVGGYEYFGWSVAGFLLGSIIAGACAGRASVSLGLRRATVLAGVAYAVGCALSALAPSFLVFVAGRVVQGLGAGAIVALCYVAIAAIFPERLWVRVFGAIAGVWGIATLFGPLIGGLFAEHAHWRGAFWFFGVQGLIFVFATFALLPAARPSVPQTPLPLKQLLMLSAGVGMIAVAGVVGQAWLAAGLGLAGLVAMALTLRINATAEGVLLPRAASDLTSLVGAGYFMIFACEAAAMGFTVYGPALIQGLHGASPLVAGYVITAMAAGWTVMALVVSSLKTDEGLMIRLGATAIVLGVVFAAWAVPRGPLWSIVLAMTLLGSGFGLSWAFVAKAIMSGLSEAEQALGSSAVPTAQLIGGAAGAAASGAVANALGFAHGVDPATAPTTGLWLFGAFVPVAVAGWIAAWRLGRKG